MEITMISEYVFAVPWDMVSSTTPLRARFSSRSRIPSVRMTDRSFFLICTGSSIREIFLPACTAR